MTADKKNNNEVKDQSKEILIAFQEECKKIVDTAKADLQKAAEMKEIIEDGDIFKQWLSKILHYPGDKEAKKMLDELKKADT